MRMENPMVGAFNRERTMLVFRQRSTEVYAAYAGLLAGAVMMALALFRLVVWRSLDGATLWFGFFGFCFAAASYWAFALFRSYTFDLRKRQYEERFGAGGRPVRIKGSFQDFDHLELMQYDGLMPNSLTVTFSQSGPTMARMNKLYVIRLCYRDPRRPAAVLEHIWSNAPGGVVDGNVVSFTQKAVQYADAIKLPLHSSIPLQPVRIGP